MRVSGMNLPDNARVALYDEYVQGAYEINAEVDINADAIEFSLVDVTVYDIITIEPIQEQPADEAEPTGQGQAEQPTDEATGEDAAEGEPTDEEPTGEDQAEQTADEPTEEEIIIEEPTDQKSAPEVQSVTVTFATEPVTAVVTVYPAATEEVPVPEAIPAQENGSFLLLPGEYTYNAEAEGYVSVEAVPFIVAEEPLTVSVILEAEEVELAPVAFEQSRTVNGVIITVKADPGVFPEGAELSVTLVPVYQQAQADAAVEEVRDEDVNVAVSYTFDIKVIDPATGEEIQPAEGQTVNVSFALAEVADENLETQVYHVTEEETTGEMTAEALDVTTEVTPETGEETTATVETDGFSIYQVEFTYNKLEYVLPGDTSVAMSEILTALGLSGEVTAVEISDESLFSASNETGEWIVTAHQAFSSTEWMKVTINGVVYEITVTDDPETVSVTYVDANGETKTCASATILTDSSTSLSAGWYVVNDDVTIADRISVSGTVNLILTNSKTLTASKGITVGSDATLNVYAQTNDEATMGALMADATNDSANWYAGIGGVENTDAGTITINGGQINAYGWCAAGIGSGGGTSTVSTITINGGIVTAQDNAHYGAGIGGGFSGGKASTINLNGGIINAAGIGSGYMGGDCSITVNISDGVKKIVSTPVQGGACIGSGKDASGSVTVNFKSGGNTVTGDAKDAVFYDSGEGSERRIYVNASSHTVTVNNDLKANITSDKEYALTGETVTLTLDTSVDATTLRVNDGAVSTTDAGNCQYTFTMPDGNVTVTATLLQTYAVTLPVNMEVVSTTNAADAGGKYITGTVVTFKASFPYAASNVSDGTSTLTATDGVYSVTIGTADITVTADFERSNPIDLSDAPGNFAVIDGDVLTGSTSHTVTIANGANITLNNATITGGIVCDGSATITLVGTNSVSVVQYNKAGIQIGGSGTTFTIRGSGSLTATGGSAAAGIGLGRTWDASVTAGTIVIEGGTVTASGDIGIGIGTVGNSQTAAIDGISIKCGTVNASLGKGYIYNGSTATVGYIKVYDGIEMVDASKITETVTYMHGDDDVTDSKTDYFTIGEDGDRRIISPKDDTDYTITIADGIEHGTLSAAATAKYMQTVTVTATPDFGYRLVRLVVKDADDNDVASTGNTFLMPKSNVTVSAVFEQGTHGTTEFAWGYPGPGSFVNEATIYDGVTTVNIHNTEVSYNILKNEEYTYSKFRLDNNTYDANIPYAGGTGEFYGAGNGTNFAFDYYGETGYYDITLTDVGNGKWGVSILPTPGQMDVVPDQTYTGSAITPEPLVIAGSLTLTKGTDYEFSYTNNTNVGTATVRATFQGDYESLGSVERTFTIMPSTIMVSVTGGGTVTIGDKSASDGEAFGVMSEKGASVTLTLAPEDGNAVRGVEYAYTNSKGTTSSGCKLPISDGTATLTIPTDLKDGTSVTLTVTFAAALVGGTDEASAVALTDATVTDLAGGWYKVESDITFDHTLNLLGDTHLVIADGATMTVTPTTGEGIDSDYTLNVSGSGTLNVTGTGEYSIAIRVGSYVQTSAVVTASGFIGIRCYNDFDDSNNDFTFSGGQLTATGTSDGIWADNTITLSCTNGNDFIQSSSYSVLYGGTISVADGKALTDGTNIYTGTLTSDEITAIKGKMLEKKTYEISFVKGDDAASGSMDPESVYAETDYTLPECGFTAPEGKAFKEWSVVIGEATAETKAPNDTITVTADTTVTAVWEEAEATPAFKFHSLLLGGQIGVNFFMDLPEIEGVDYSSSYMEFTVKGRTTTDPFDSEHMSETGGYYGFTCRVNSVQMADEITAVFHYGDNLTVTQTYSVIQYMQDFETMSSQFDSKIVDVVHAMADYGHYVQPFLATQNHWTVGTDHAEMSYYHTASYSNADMTAVSGAVSEHAIVRDPGNSKIDHVAFSLYLDTETSIYVYLYVKDGYTGTVTATLDGGNSNVAEKISENQYRVKINNISAHLLGEKHNILVNAEGEFTVTVSALSYVQGILASDAYKNNTEAVNAVIALYYYYSAAHTYKPN